MSTSRKQSKIVTHKFTAVRQIKPYFIYDPRVLQKNYAPIYPIDNIMRRYRDFKNANCRPLLENVHFNKGSKTQKDKVQGTSGKTKWIHNSQNITHSVHCCTSSMISKSTFKVKGDQSQPRSVQNFSLQYNGHIFGLKDNKIYK